MSKVDKYLNVHDGKKMWKTDTMKSEEDLNNNITKKKIKWKAMNKE